MHTHAGLHTQDGARSLFLSLSLSLSLSERDARSLSLTRSRSLAWACARAGLGNHFDRRDKWAEGIASIAWSDAPGVSDPRGDPWALRMQIGPESNAIESIVTTLPAGSAYLMTGKSQGRSEVCQRHCVAHEFCTCCWTHGVWNEQSQQTRQSITLRVFDLEWGRSGLPSSGLPSASADGGDAE